MTSSEKAAQELCQSCGLCCEGLLHSHGALMPHEVGEAAALGLDLVEGAEPGFSLPCPRFDRCCTIYEMRPNACRGFRRALLRRLDEGSVDLDDALEIVSEALKLGNEAMPGATAAELAKRFREHLRMRNSGHADGMNSAERLTFIALALFLDRHFVLPGDGNFYSFLPVESSQK